jgi:hypothetical protein
LPQALDARKDHAAAGQTKGRQLNAAAQFWADKIPAGKP